MITFSMFTLNFLRHKCRLEFLKTMKVYNIKRCFYGHLHGNSHKEAINGIVCGIEFKLISSDYLDFDLVKVEN